MKLSRRTFLTFPFMAWLLTKAEPAQAAPTFQEQKKSALKHSRIKAEELLGESKDFQDVNSIKLFYDLYMIGRFNTNVKTTASISYERGYNGTINLDMPVGVSLLDKFLLGIGKITGRLSNLENTVNVELSEIFHRKDRFYTDVFEQNLIDKGRSQKAIKLLFIYATNKILFWKDKNNGPPVQKEYMDEMCPISAFWEYVFFLDDVSQIKVLNCIKRPNRDTGKMEHIFQQDTVSARKHKGVYTLHHTLGNLYDIVWDQPLYTLMSNDQIKFPPQIFIKGIFDKAKLDKAKAKGQIPGLSELAARDVNCYLKKYILG